MAGNPRFFLFKQCVRLKSMTTKDLIKKITPYFLINAYHYALSLSGAILYGFPSKNLIVIGVTGTSGKSTTVDLITRILEEAGNRVASLSSIRFKVGNNEWENKLKMTMPGRFKIQKFLWQAKKDNCKYVVLEVTSQGIMQFRHKFVNFKTAVFTNLSKEHIEAHGSFENYRNAKLKLFKATNNIHIINLDDENAKYFLEVPSKEKWGYTLKNKKDAKLTSIVSCTTPLSKEDSIFFEIKNTKFNLKLTGDFNIYNSVSSICVALSENISLEICKLALEKIKGIVGRMEIVAEKPFKVVVDYAHTPDQLESVYKSFEGKNLICVLGSCGGGRDKWKRPVLGKIAKEYCKTAIITNEDPYDENPEDIIDQVLVGTEGLGQKITDRRKAIKKALELATPDDVVIITGKGSESLMCIENGRKIPWSDSQIAREELIRLEKE